MLAFVFLSVFPVLVLVAAFKDATTFTIPNWLCMLVAAAFLPAALAVQLPLPAFATHLGVGLAGLLIGAGLFAAGWLGGGDAKLFAAASLWFGWPDTGQFLLYTALAGGGLAIVLLLGRRVSPALPSATPAWASRLFTPGGAVPYGIAIAIGALVAFPDSAMMRGVSPLG